MICTGTDIFSLKGKTALVTGATGYLGREMAFALAEAGAHVLVNSRNRKRADDLTKEICVNGLSAEGACFDVTSIEEVKLFASKLTDRPLDIIVNNAYSGSAGNVETSEAQEYIKSYDIGVVSIHALCQSLLPSLRLAAQENNDASVINISSMYGLVSPDLTLYDSAKTSNPPFYGAAKAALLQWSRYAACEFGHEGIRFNAICPGPFPSMDIQTKNPEFITKLGQKVPMKRVGQSFEIKGVILFLASPASSYVNGASISVDGGWTAW